MINLIKQELFQIMDEAKRRNSYIDLNKEINKLASKYSRETDNRTYYEVHDMFVDRLNKMLGLK
jgi:hypothetical protein